MNLNSNLYYIELASYLRDHGELNPKAFIIPFFSSYPPGLVAFLLFVNHLTVCLLPSYLRWDHHCCQEHCNILLQAKYRLLV